MVLIIVINRSYSQNYLEGSPRECPIKISLMMVLQIGIYYGEVNFESTHQPLYTLSAEDRSQGA